MPRSPRHDRMRSAGAALLACLVAAILITASHPCRASAEGGSFAAGEIQVRLSGAESIESINRRLGTTTADSLPPAYLLHLPDGGNVEEWVDRLAEDASFSAVECSWIDETPEGVRQMVVIVVGGTEDDYHDQGLVPRLHLPELRSTHSGAGVLVAVIDTGVHAAHEVLAGAIERGGWDFVDGDGDASEEASGEDEDGDGLIDEGAGHGTMVAGIIRLVAPQARILPIRALDDEGRGRVFDLARAIRHAVDRGAQVINLSLGLMQHTFVVQDQILYANQRGVAIIGAAGNLADENPPYYPAMDPQVISVAALDSCDVKAEFSSWHRSVDLSAPGVGVLAPFIDGEYALGAGTSFSVPFITGQCACILGALPGLPLMELYRLSAAGVVDIYGIEGNEPYADELGSGRIDGVGTLQAIQGASAVDSAPVVGHPGFAIWPNPSRPGEEVRLAPCVAGLAGFRRLTIHDATGRQVRAVPANADADGIVLVRRGDLSLPAGVWYLRVDGADLPPARIVRVR